MDENEYVPELKNILKEDILKPTEETFYNGCGKCNAGYIEDGKLCDCFKLEIKKRKYVNSNIKYDFASLELKDEIIDAYIKNGNDKVKINMSNFINQYVKNSNENIKNGTGFIINGGTGRGKSLSAMKTLMFLVDKRYKCYWATVKEYLDIIKKSWEDDNYKRLLNYIYDCDFLAIDDLGVEMHKTDWPIVELDSLFRHRYFKNKPVIMTSNQSITNLKEKYAQRIVSLFYEKLMFITIVTNEDFREKNSKLPSYLNLEELKGDKNE